MKVKPEQHKDGAVCGTMGSLSGILTVICTEVLLSKVKKKKREN